MAKGHFLFGFLLGGAAAFAATRLLAPESSDELRDNVARKVNQFRDKAADYADFADENGDDFADIAGGDTLDNFEDIGVGATAATDTPADDEADSGADFADINLEGQSAFAEAKDADDAAPTSEAPVSDSEAPAAADDTPGK